LQSGNPPRSGCDRLACGQAAGMLSEPLYTEKLMPYGLSVIPRRNPDYFRFGSDC
jgi:hypothetical protein